MNYDTAKLRQFIQEHFSPDDLRTLLFDYFRPVHDDLTDGMTKSKQIALLLEYCHNHGKIPDLLASLQRERSFFQPDDYSKGQKAPATIKPATQTTPTRNPRQIFISHAHQDAEVAQKLAHDLEAHGYDIWIAPDSIRPGEKWVEAINRGLEESGLFVLLLSPDAVASRWVTMETNAAIEFEHEDEMQLYPLMLKACRVPALWRVYQHISLLDSYEQGLDQLLGTLISGEQQQDREIDIHRNVFSTEPYSKPVFESPADEVGDFQPDQEFIMALARSMSPERGVADDKEIASFLNRDREEVRNYLNLLANRGLVKVNRQAFSLSGNAWSIRLTNDGQTKLKPFMDQDDLNTIVHPKTGQEMVRVPAGDFLYGDDKQKMHLDEFWIARTPVTNAEYAKFVADTNRKPPKHWKGKTPSADLADHPVVYISWYDAKAYAEWAEAELPTEQQWEKAARGEDGRKYPWGDEWRDNHCNIRKTGIGKTTPVGQYSPQGDSPYGCVDMVGNVWEWTNSWYGSSKASRVLCGGSWGNLLQLARRAGRVRGNPDYSFYYLGFRVVSPVVSGF